jgi:hypothetical protein
MYVYIHMSYLFTPVSINISLDKVNNLRNDRA